jgi:hypothetical protein
MLFRSFARAPSSGGLLREGKRVKFSFIHAEKACFPVAALCRVLEVSRQGYYAFAAREPGQRSPASA